MHEEDPTITVDDRQDMLEREAQEWLVRLTSGRATIADAEALKSWCGRSKAHAAAFAEANLLWEGLGTAARRKPSDGASARDRSRGATASRRWFLGGAAAASVAGIGYLGLRPPLELWPSPYELAADYRTGVGERRQIAMDNGVSVELNTRSSLNIVRDTGERQIELVSGEAAIVVPDTVPAGLTVLAAGGSLYAASAQFNLRCDGGRAIVTCHRGSMVIDYSGKSMTLHGGEQTIYARGALEPVLTVDPAVVMAWREGQLVFRQTPLAEVIDEVNRYRQGRIILMNETLGRRPVEARISLDRVDDLINLVREAYGAKVTSLPGGVVVLT
ncbi:FecR domain-containing protein [Bradyrhizobium sp. Arg237L]|uniref:FecR family protein n=1 Tax=Bradyrhizobium sp. Arg237L TaxID=3003352 RepID=UPI00249E0E5A|nr:FecR domain-containing protein [Bradyrhizobium sp. Arg237L]MDI4233754.1 FecR domain-containing protein [Bradyrhizobium sp. Arg237L]